MFRLYTVHTPDWKERLDKTINLIVGSKMYQDFIRKEQERIRLKNWDGKGLHRKSLEHRLKTRNRFSREYYQRKYLKEKK